MFNRCLGIESQIGMNGWIQDWEINNGEDWVLRDSLVIGLLFVVDKFMFL